MKILLLGDYSGLHYNLAEGLRVLGHQVVVASDGDDWKNYKRDINLKQPKGVLKSLWAMRLLANLHRFVGYDVVQLIHPNFIRLRPEKIKIVFSFLSKHNKSVYLGANGTDSIFINYALSGRYVKSLLNEKELRSNYLVQNYVNTCLVKENKELNHYIAEHVKGISAVCAEYYIAYSEIFSNKTEFIPLPIKTNKFEYCNTINYKTDRLVFFLGHLKQRSVLKGTHIIEQVLLELKKSYPLEVEINAVSGVSYNHYVSLMNNSHILCDQLYSYGCGLNGVLGLSKGLIVAGGGLDEMYKLLGEKDSKPIINLPSDINELYDVFENIINNKNLLVSQALMSREFAVKHHDYIKVALRYINFWERFN